MERPWCLICQVHSRESENAWRSALWAATYFSSRMRYYTSEKCNRIKLAERIGRNEWNSSWNAYLGQRWANSQSQWCLRAGFGTSIPLDSRAGSLRLRCREESSSPESWPFFQVTESENNSISGTSEWSQCVKVKDARHSDVLKHLDDVLHHSLFIRIFHLK